MERCGSLNVRQDMMHRGMLKVEGMLSSDSDYVKGSKGQKLYAFRVFAGAKKETKLTDDDQYIRTYTVINDEDSSDGKGAVNDMVNAVGEAWKQRTHNADPPISEVDIIVKDNAPFVSKICTFRFFVGAVTQ
jgi:hypothetical protein